MAAPVALLLWILRRLFPRQRALSQKAARRRIWRERIKEWRWERHHSSR